MTPAERLAQLSHACHLLAQDWPLWAARIADTLPDGYKRQTAGGGAIGGHTGGISDPTGEAALQREAITRRDGVDLIAQVDRLSANLVELTLAMATAAIGHAPTPRAEHTPGVRLAIASLALRTCQDHARVLNLVQWDGDSITPAQAREYADSYIATLRRIIPATKVDATGETCRCPRDGRGTWGRDECGELASSRHDGLAPACYQRRRRWELRREAAA